MAASDLAPLEDRLTSVNQVLFQAVAARLRAAQEEETLLAPLHTRVVPLPHQLWVLQQALLVPRLRLLLGDEVGLGKTIEAGLILRELKLRGLVRRVLVVTPKGLIRQWQAEFRQHFQEKLHFVEPSELAAFRPWRTQQESLWQRHDQVLVSLDSVKPLEARRGWSLAQLQQYNQERFEDLLSAGWDLVIIDEAHRLGGSTDQVARYKLGSALAEASPYLLLLSATPHQGKADQFLRLLQLLDREAFPDEASVTRSRVRPYLLRTEKRSARDAEGNALFKPRLTRLVSVEWQERHGSQQLLYEAVSSYVRHGYNQSQTGGPRRVNFLLILLQRLVTSSTAAIRATLEKRLALLDQNEPQLELGDGGAWDDWEELDGESQVDLALRLPPLAREKAEVAKLLELARSTEAQGTDAKAERLLELLYKLQQEEGDPELKVLLFTEFVPTQQMLAGLLEARGFSVALLNGGLSLEARAQAQADFSREYRVLLSTDAGGEGLNLQFCHVVINFDMPWNPMRLEQRIGRVDRIGQKQVVRAINLVLEETVEHRVRQVLEEKLALIAEQFGVDKASDVLDSVEVEPLFEEAYLRSLRQPEQLVAACQTVVEVLKSQWSRDRDRRELLKGETQVDLSLAQRWREHPAQYWLERALKTGLPLQGGTLETEGSLARLRWPEDTESALVCFEARASEAHPEATWITLEEPRVRALLREPPPWQVAQPVPCLRLPGLPSGLDGFWSLWELSLHGGDRRKRQYLPLFLNREGRAFGPTAQRIWELLLSEIPELVEERSAAGALWYQKSFEVAQVQGEPLYQELVLAQQESLEAEKGRLQFSFEAQFRGLDRLGLPTVRDYRRRQLEQTKRQRLAELTDRGQNLPELRALLLLGIRA